jgi:hypothetical protein
VKKAFHQLIIKSEVNIKFEFTALGTPQKNDKVECAFATHFGKTRSIRKAARITLEMEYRQTVLTDSASLKHYCYKEGPTVCC